MLLRPLEVSDSCKNHSSPLPHGHRQNENETEGSLYEEGQMEVGKLIEGKNEGLMTGGVGKGEGRGVR